MVRLQAHSRAGFRVERRGGCRNVEVARRERPRRCCVHDRGGIESNAAVEVVAEGAKCRVGVRGGGECKCGSQARRNGHPGMLTGRVANRMCSEVSDVPYR